MTKLKFLKKFEFFKFLSKFYIKVLKNRLILNKNFPSGPQVEGALWDSRPPASHGEASGIFIYNSLFSGIWFWYCLFSFDVSGYRLDHAVTNRVGLG